MMIIAIILGILLTARVATYVTYGGFVKKEVQLKYLNLNTETLERNPFSRSVISCNNWKTLEYISTVPFDPLCKYYISGVGTVPRWSRLHKKIKEYYKILQAKDNGVV